MPKQRKILYFVVILVIYEKLYRRIDITLKMEKRKISHSPINFPQLTIQCCIKHTILPRGRLMWRNWHRYCAWVYSVPNTCIFKPWRTCWLLDYICISQKKVGSISAIFLIEEKYQNRGISSVDLHIEMIDSAQKQ